MVLSPDPLGIVVVNGRDFLLLEDGRLLPAICGGGGGKSPSQPKAQPAPPDPEAEAAKKKAAEERAKLQSKRGASRTIATSPVGVLGAAPTSRPDLRGTLG